MNNVGDKSWTLQAPIWAIKLKTVKKKINTKSNILVGATENWNALVHWAIGFQYFFPALLSQFSALKKIL